MFTHQAKKVMVIYISVWQMQGLSEGTGLLREYSMKYAYSCRASTEYPAESFDIYVKSN